MSDADVGWVMRGDARVYHVRVGDETRQFAPRGKLFDELNEELEEGRALFKTRVSPELFAKNFYDRAIIDILVRSKGHVQSKLW